ncbi:hypothetical protein RI129_008379 [Pyrocoelia pectoralis]|uniref:DNA polymerase delta subunit 3 n=1 Tax=Pyrocoelia pectoralis TaxID=417401 RepID=A0AAN7ZG00_9COLE
MDTDTINDNIKKLEELVIDEDKIVTIPFICTTFNVTSKESKLLLQEFIASNRKIHPGSLSLTYILSGLRDNNLPSISIVKEDDLDDKKDLYIGEPIAEIYSVQKCKEIDFNSVTLIDYFDAHNPREIPIKGSIVSKNCIKRQLKTKPVVPVPTPKEKPLPITKAPSKPTPHNGIKQSPKSSNVKMGMARKTASVAQLFKNVEPKCKPATTEGSHSNGDVQTEVKNTLQNLVDSDHDDDIVKATPEPPTPKNSKKRKSAKKDQNSKRRKRIIVEEQSDEDIFGNDEDEEEEISKKRKNVLEDSEEDEPIAKPEPVPIPKNKKRRLVDKTFEDEEGYIITRKEWVIVSGSEDEGGDVAVVPTVKVEATKVQVKEVDEKKEDTPVVHKNDKVVNGKAPTTKGKKTVPTNQPTLMNFFKKK